MFGDTSSAEMMLIPTTLYRVFQYFRTDDAMKVFIDFRFKSAIFITLFHHSIDFYILLSKLS
jgi:hypothetical protein